MQLNKYFTPGQKIRLKILRSESGKGIFEALTGFVEECRTGRLEVSLPYQVSEDEAYPFTEGMPLEVLAENFGLGISLKAHYAGKIAPNLHRIEVDEQLQAFQRRTKKRTDSTVGLRFSKGDRALKSLRERWRKNTELLHSGRDLSSLKSFSACNANLSAGGLRFEVATPVKIADIFLLLIELHDGGPPVCALAETVWTSTDMAKSGKLVIGLQFIAVMEEDQKRIDDFVKRKTG
ncbi:MAG: PilZ domain-containing protein [Desulfuromonadales bacterium]